MRKLLCLVSIFMIIPVFSPGYLSAQQFKITGSLYNGKDSTSLSGAYVSLISVNDSIRRVSVTRSSGEFELLNIPPGRYLVKYSYLGFHTDSIRVEIINNNVNLGRRGMAEEPVSIRGVEVVGYSPAAEITGDTVQFQAIAYQTMPDANAEDMVKKLPGVVVEDGKVSAQGEEVKEVLVDGRPFFRNDPTATLRTLPAEVIDKIQIFDRQSDQAEFTGFSDGETSKTMNIITRVNMRNGKFGKAMAGYGYEDKYLAGGNINLFKENRRLTIIAQSNNVNQQNFSSDDLLGIMAGGRRGGPQMGGGSMMGGGRGFGGGGGGGGGGRGESSGGQFRGGGDTREFMVGPQSGISKTHAFGINYSDMLGKKIDITGSYFFNWSDNMAEEVLNREYTLSADSGQTYDENSVSNSRNMNHRINLRLEYNINENNSLFIRPSLSIQQNNGSTDFSGLTTRESEKLSLLDNLNKSDLSATSFSNTMMFRHRFLKEGRTLSLNLSTSYNDRSGNSSLLSEIIYYTDTSSEEDINQRATLLTDGWSVSSNLMYTEPAGKNGSLQLNYQQSWQKNKSDKETYDFTPALQDYSLLDTLLSNRFDNIYLSSQAGAGYRYGKDKIHFTGRLIYQQSRLDNDQVFPSEYNLKKSYQNLLANAVFRYSPSRTKNLNITYRTGTRPPSVSQLQEVVDNTNPLQLKTGNGDLKQSYEHNLFMRYSSVRPESSKLFFILLGGGYTEHYIANSNYLAYRDTLMPGGLLLREGSQLIMPVNLSGYWNMMSFMTWGLPLSKIMSNLNFNASANFSRIPGLINGSANHTDNTGFGLGAVLSSNIKDNLDFAVSVRGSYNIARNSLREEQNSNYFNQNTRVHFRWIFFKGFFLETDLSQTSYTGLSEGYNQNYRLWNGGIGKKIFASQRGEIKLSVYDILDQNKDIRRSVNDFYIEDSRTYTLQRYFLLTFTYNLRNFNSQAPSGNFGPPPGSFRPPRPGEID